MNIPKALIGITPKSRMKLQQKSLVGITHHISKTDFKNSGSVGFWLSFNMKTKARLKKFALLANLQDKIRYFIDIHL